MNIPLLDLKAQFDGISNDLKTAVMEVLESTQYVMGENVTKLENEIAKYCGTEFAVGLSSGTDALLVALMALDVKQGDIVITTDYSFFATAGVVSRLGANPVFIDINPDTYNISTADLSKWFKENKEQIPNVKAIIPVHLYGQCANMDEILNIANEHGIPVVEDAAQAIGSRYKSDKGILKAGSMGTCGCFSFFPSKNLGGIGDGGMLTTNDGKFAEKVTLLRNHGAHNRYHHAIIGGNFRLDAIQAAALLVKLPHLDNWHKKRQENAKYYDSLFTGTCIKTPTIAYERAYHIYNQYIIYVPERRDELQEFLSKNNIGCAIYYPIPFHAQQCFEDFSFKSELFKNSNDAALHTLALPIYPELERNMQDSVVEKILSFF